jgi:hypothetical protein
VAQGCSTRTCVSKAWHAWAGRVSTRRSPASLGACLARSLKLAPGDGPFPASSSENTTRSWPRSLPATLSGLRGHGFEFYQPLNLKPSRLSTSLIRVRFTSSSRFWGFPLEEDAAS